MTVLHFCCSAANARTPHTGAGRLIRKRCVSFQGRPVAMDPVSKAFPSSRAGRPRSEGCRRRILAAADSLLTRDGFAGTSVDDIAATAGVSKATIYRWWPNKAAVVMEALLDAIEADFKGAADGDAEKDLIARIRRTIALFRSPKGRMLASLIGEAQFDPELAEAYRQRLLRPRRAGLQAALLRAVAAGTLRPDVDLELATDIVYGPL